MPHLRNLALLACVVLSALGAPAAPPHVARPNVLFIAIDDLRPELGCMGTAHAATPHIDRLAAGGALFTRHYVAVPTCGASRYALLTGRDPRRSGVRQGNEGLFRGAARLLPEAQPAAQSLPELFRQNGYRTALVGKVSHTPDGRVFAYDGSGDGRPEMPHAWDELATPNGPWKRGWGAFFAYPGGRHREDGGGHRDLTDFTVEGDDELPDGLMAGAAIEQLAALKASGEPFFLGLGFFKPHLPFVAPAGDRAAAGERAIPPPAAPGRPASSYWHGSGEFHRYAAAHERGAALDETEALEVRRAYAACVSYVDRQVGRVLDALDELGLADDTIVVLWGDHGWHLGESALWGKHSPHERALHAPLIVRGPGVTAGRGVDALASTIDIYPTLVELCALEERATRWPLDGVSLVPLLAGDATSVRGSALSTWGRAVSVRTDDRRLVARETDEGFEDVELYDATRGPDPIEDLAAEEPERVAAILAWLREH